ncbi:MAG: riboflavin kinase [Bacteroidales bacterium]|nr:riboflavin kinase [Bacteroidales bacterium]
MHDFTTEVHIFDFDKEIYGEEITICFVDRIRDEKKF